VYWELWYVDTKGTIRRPILKGESFQADPDPSPGDFWNNKEAGSDTKGRYDVNGKLYFIPIPAGQNFAPPKGWAFWKQAPDVEPANKILPGGLPYSCVDPKIDETVEGIEIAKRSLKATWNCCGCDDPDEKKDDVKVDFTRCDDSP